MCQKKIDYKCYNIGNFAHTGKEFDIANTRLELQGILRDITQKATKLKDARTGQYSATISWCCVFCQSDSEYERFAKTISEYGWIAKDTHNGPVYVIPPLETSAGLLRVVKIRMPDRTRPERGDADFKVVDYAAFKARYIGLLGFKLIERDNFEMIELMDEGEDVRVYFSNPPVDQHDGIREALARQPVS